MASGRSRAYMRHFGVSRIVFREMAHAGKLPGCGRRVGEGERTAIGLQSMAKR